MLLTTSEHGLSITKTFFLVNANCLANSVEAKERNLGPIRNQTPVRNFPIHARPNATQVLSIPAAPFYVPVVPEPRQ